MTYRERREARAERLREWADGREQKSTAALEQAHKIASGIPFGQPILVGHHSERGHRRDIAKIDAGMSAGIEHGRKADAMRSSADTIDAQAAQAIYSDDPDAAERLHEKIERLEAERARIKAYNASCRKAAKTGGTGDLSLLDEGQRKGLLATARVCAWQLGKGGAMPAYELSLLGANIRKARERLADIESGRSQRRAQTDRPITARYGGKCSDCGAPLERGQMIRYSRAAGARCHPACASEEEG